LVNFQNCEIRRTLNLKLLLLLVERSQRHCFGHVSGCKPYCLNQGESGPQGVHGPGGVTTSPTFLGPVLMWSHQNYPKFPSGPD